MEDMILNKRMLRIRNTIEGQLNMSVNLLFEDLIIFNFKLGSIKIVFLLLPKIEVHFIISDPHFVGIH